MEEVVLGYTKKDLTTSVIFGIPLKAPNYSSLVQRAFTLTQHNVQILVFLKVMMANLLRQEHQESALLGPLPRIVMEDIFTVASPIS